MNHPALVDFNQALQGIYAAYKQLQMEGGAGCQALIQQTPTDPVPLINALAALRQRVERMISNVESTWSDQYAPQLGGQSDQWVANEGARMSRDARRWLREQWDSFDCGWRVQQFHAMWPHVEAARSQAATCTGCGGSLGVIAGDETQAVTCNFCKTVNQVSPPAVVSSYYATAPDTFAQWATLPLRFKLDQLRDAWSTERAAIRLRTGEWPDEPLPWLQERERQENAYWTAYADARAQVAASTPEQKKAFVESRMQPFYDEMGRNEVWRAAHGMGELRAVVPQHLRDAVEWGPLKPDQVEEFFRQQALLRQVESDPAKHQRLLAKLGYRDAQHRALVEQTFNRYHDGNMGQPWFQEQFMRGNRRALEDRSSLFEEDHAADLEPIEGVSIELYGELCAEQSSASAEEFLVVLAKHQLDRETFDRASAAWQERMRRDTAGVIGPRFSKGFMASSAGDDTASAVTFETFAEITGAMSAWSQQGKDTTVMLKEHFDLTPAQFAKVSMKWSQKMTTEMSMMTKFSEMMTKAQNDWLAR